MELVYKTKENNDVRHIFRTIRIKQIQFYCSKLFRRKQFHISFVTHVNGRMDFLKLLLICSLPFCAIGSRSGKLVYHIHFKRLSKKILTNVLILNCIFYFKDHPFGGKSIDLVRYPGRYPISKCVRNCKHDQDYFRCIFRCISPRIPGFPTGFPTGFPIGYEMWLESWVESNKKLSSNVYQTNKLKRA